MSFFLESRYLLRQGRDQLPEIFGGTGGHNIIVRWRRRFLLLVETPGFGFLRSLLVVAIAIYGWWTAVEKFGMPTWNSAAGTASSVAPASVVPESSVITSAASVLASPASVPVSVATSVPVMVSSTMERHLY